MGSDPDLISIFGKAGKGIASIFKSKRARADTSQPEPLPSPSATLQPDDHGLSFGIVYANSVAAPELDKPTRRFPVGSILVRERLDSITSITPITVIAMVKREPGFSKKTSDWEFLMFSGSDLKLHSRETAGRCAECHTNARDTDWVFIDKLKK